MNTNVLHSTYHSNTMIDVMLDNLRSNPHDTIFTFLKDGESPSENLTNEQLYGSALSISRHLQEQGVRPGDRIILLYPSGLDFIKAFIACMFAGAIAVPARLPKKNRPLNRILGIIGNAKPKLILSQGRIKEELTDIFLNSGAQHLSIIDSQLITDQQFDDSYLVKASSDSIAFLQYTSGSTGSPKGVIITQENIVTNQRQIQHGYRTNRDSRLISWLPAHHDMGLIGGILHPIFVGLHCQLMSPAAFVQKPIRWLRAITQFGATMSGGPNFGYDLCVKYIKEEDKTSLDLSTWTRAASGAEKVRPETIDAFTKHFEPSGFKRRAFYPCYGMAETTLFISGGDPEELPIVRRVAQSTLSGSGANEDIFTEIVGCGKALIEEEIVIANPDNKNICEPETVGEIWVQGKNVASGYWENDEATEGSFRAYLNNAIPGQSPGPYFRTGDLGFVDASGELYICGRLKELLILNGVNYHPQDIERTAQNSHPAMTLNGGAAFSIEENGKEVLVVVNEIERKAWRGVDQATIFDAIKRCVSSDHELEVGAIILIKPMSLMKTFSGKIQRVAIRKAFLNGQLSAIAEYRRDEKSTRNTYKHPHEQPTGQSHPPRQQQHKSSVNTQRLGAQHFSARQIEQWLVAQLAQELDMPPASIDVDMPLADCGLSSLATVKMTGALEEYLQTPLQSTLLYDYSNIARLAEHLAKSSEHMNEKNSQTKTKFIDDKIAVIGIGCRFPGSVKGPKAFWQLLINGENAVSEVPKDRWQWDGRNKATRFGGFVDKVGEFDAAFFNISPKEAESLDPQQRLLLEVCWQAIEDSVQAPTQLKNSKTGVFVGLSNNDYSRLIEQTAEVGRYFATGNSFSTAAGRIAYVLGLTGPALALDTSCSSSLVAVHNARSELLQGNCDMALAGGASLMLTATTTNALNTANMLSVDGRCATFDTQANGYVRGEGCGIVVLKRLADAERDGDRIYGIIRGSALNQDGNSNGLTAPNGLAQQQVIHAALANAEVTANDIDYIEAHGTGTQLGDPIELNALQVALASQRDKNLLIGSVKTNIGHLESAAGVAGLIKVLLSLHHKKIPAHLHLKQKSTHFDWRGIDVPVTTCDWGASKKSYQKTPSRLAGISSFGFSGTNAHIVLEQSSQAIGQGAVPELKTEPEQKAELLTLSAKSESVLITMLKQLGERVADNIQNIDLNTICKNVNKVDCRFNYRFTAVASSKAELIKKLQLNTGKNIDCVQGKQALTLFFPGQGAQHLNMGRELYQSFSVYKDVLDRCDTIVQEKTGWSLRDQIFADNTEKNRDELAQTGFSQPALFVVEYALYHLLRSFGLTPSTLLGHSLGEYVAACVAGVFRLEDALSLVCLRGKLMQAQENGAMLSVSAAVDGVETMIKKNEALEIAAINGPKSIVVSGPHDAIEHFKHQCQIENIAAKRIAVSHAFHSQMMAPMLDEYSAALRSVRFFAPNIPIISNLSGTFVGEEIRTPEYWCEHITAPVKFFAGVQTLAQEVGGVFLECGPTPILTALAKEGLRQASAMQDRPTAREEDRPPVTEKDNTPAEKLAFIPTLRGGKHPETAGLLNALAALYRRGCNLDLRSLHSSKTKVLALLHYPFEHKRYWVKQSNQPTLPASPVNAHPLIGSRLSLPLSKEIRFASNLRPSAPAYMNDHRLYGTVISPAASHISSILTSAGHISEHAQFLVHNVSFEQAMILKEDSALDVQIIYEPQESKAYRWSLVSTAKGQDEPLVHARGSITPGVLSESPATVMNVEEPSTLMSRCGKQSQGAEFYKKMWDGGYHLGSAFKWLSKIYQGDDETGAAIVFPTLPDDINDYAIYPGLLDSCLQMVSLCCERVLDLRGGEFLYVPIKLEKLFYYRPIVAGEKLWCHSQALAHLISNTCLAANIALYDEFGLPVLILEGFETRRVSRDLLLTNVEQQESALDWLYDIQWKVEQRPGYWLPPDFIPPVEHIAEDLKNSWQNSIEQPALQSYPDILKRLENDSVHYIIEGLLTLGWQYPAGEVLSADSVVKTLAVEKNFTRLVFRMLSILAEEHYLDRQQNQFTVLREIHTGGKQISRSTEGDIAESAEFVLLDRCGAKLAETLRGDKDALELLFPGGDTSTLTELYTHSPGAKALNTLVKQSVAAAIAHLPKNRRLRVLEVGAGTGGTTAHLLPLFESSMTEYVFTDMSHLFLSQAQEKFSECPFVQYELLDIEQSPLHQGYRQHHYDIIIAANVLHATRDIKETLCNIHQLLATNGMIVMLEGTTELRWLDLTFGLTEGWWRYEDTDVRPHHPLMSADQWHNVLRATDFTQPHTLTNLADSSKPMQEQSVIVAQRGSHESRQKHWLICADHQGVAQHLATSLCELGDLCSIVQFNRHTDAHSAISFLPPVQDAQNINIYTLNDYEPQSFADALKKVEFAQNCQVDEVIQLQGLDAPNADQADTSTLFDFVQQLVCGNLAVIKTLATDLDNHPRKLRLVSTNAVNIHGDTCSDTCKGIAASPLWGLGKTLMLEYPELRCQRIDLESDEPFNVANELLALLYANSSEPEITLRKGLMHYSRLQKVQQSYSPSTLDINSAGTYLITGGLSGLGLLCAKWLVEKGARNLILLGRSQASPEVQAHIHQWRQAGVEVGVYQADVGDLERMQTLAENAWTQLPPLTGVIHSAGVLDDASLMKQSWEKFAKVMKSKVKGAWNLHRVTEGCTLDFFVLFSSAASLLGSPGQANHSAANSFMDALSAYRRGINLPALSINWGAWSDIGAASRHQAEKHLSNRGVASITPDKGIELFEHILGRPETRHQIGVVPFDWSRFEMQLKEMDYPPFYAELAERHLVNKKTQDHQSENQDWLNEVDQACASDRLAMLTTYVVDKVAEALGLASGNEVDIVKPINELGFDSLMAMDLVSDFNKQLGIKMPSSKLFQNPSVTCLAEISLDLMVAAKVLSDSDDSLQSASALSQPSGSPWIAHHQPNSNTKLRLLCFHYLGGGASVFREWSDYLGPDIDVCAIQLPGREERIDEQPYDRMQTLIDALLEQIHPLLDQPFALYGHSMGSLIGFELIRAIGQRWNLQPVHFWASAYYAPHRESPFQKTGHWEDKDILSILPRLIEAPKRVLENESFVNTMLPTIRGDLGIVSTYVYTPGEPLNCPITAMGGSLDKEVFAEDVSHWASHTSQKFTQIEFSGGHIFVNDNKDELLEHINFTLQPLSIFENAEQDIVTQID